MTELQRETQNEEEGNRKNLTRKELAEILTMQLGYPYSSCAKIVDSFFAALKEGMLAGENIKLVHFGTFSLRSKSPRRGRNPRTGEEITIKRRRAVSFRPSKKLKDRINA